jgi:Cu/Ag efflux protein CusF
MFRSLLALALPAALSACMQAEPATANVPSNAVPLGVDLGGSGPVVAMADEGHAAATQRPAGMQMAHEGHNDAHDTGTVQAVDAAQHKLTISHNPISIGWPAVVMEFAAAPSVDLNSIKPGARVNFTIQQGAGGMYEVQSLSPAGSAP